MQEEKKKELPLEKKKAMVDLMVELKVPRFLTLQSADLIFLNFQ